MKDIDGRKTISARLEPQIIEQLKFLCEKYHCSTTAMLVTLIRAEYSKFETDPTYQKTLESLEYLKNAFEKVSTELNALEKQ